MNRNGMTISRTMERKGNVRRAAPVRTTVERTMGSLADKLSRRNLIAARCELCNEALWQLTALCYECHDNGDLCNVDPVTGMVLIPMPTGWTNYRVYGLRRTESDALRYALLYWQQSERYPLFQYDESRKRWFIAIGNYRTLESAHGWLQAHQVTPELWQNALPQRAP